MEHLNHCCKTMRIFEIWFKKSKSVNAKLLYKLHWWIGAQIFHEARYKIPTNKFYVKHSKCTFDKLGNFKQNRFDKIMKTEQQQNVSCISRF